MVLEWFIPAILLLLGLWITLTHRRLTRLRRQAIAGWAPLEVALRQRHELLPPLIQAVLAHAPAARSATQGVMQARQAALQAGLSPEAAGAAEIRLAAAIQRVLGLAKTHPELAADLTFRRIQARFEELSGAILALGDDFNAGALVYNRAAMSFPAILVAKYASLFLLEYFALEGPELEAMHAAGLGRRP